MNRHSVLLPGCVSALFALCCQLYAIENINPSPPWQMIVQWDNDLLTGTDQDYTNGSRVAFIREFEQNAPVDNLLQKGLYALSGAAADAPFHNLRLPNGGDLRFAGGIGLTHLMFTPDNPTATSAPRGERPYAAWLGLELSLHAKTDDSVSSVTLSLGTTGKYSYGEESQEWVHTHISGSPIFQGWDSQVPAEFTANLHLDHKRRIRSLDTTKDWPIEIDGYTEWGVGLGNLRTDAYLGSLLRAGWNLPATYSTPRVQLGSYAHALFREEDPKAAPLSILGFAGVRGSAVLHDISLDGPVFRKFNTGVESKPLAGELLVGLSLRYGRCDLSFSRTQRTDEFTGQNQNQEFGSVMFRFHSNF
jgi:lipid A 3-O-deacylase